ncbi:diuretic hormone receptor-like isoform X1 [Branchiostoma lanceolatum]|uniref:diuretic hormone receptor-like isoform X1 n=1 Tax=Branchiostoma lanceolatum TaxID=7740 RepID=UPI0034528DCD
MAQLFYNNGTPADWQGLVGPSEGGQIITEAGKCVERGRSQSPLQGLYCNSSFDNIYCWPDTPAGFTVYLPCPKGYDNTKILAYRICTEAGEWLKGNWSNYTLCVPHKLRRVPPDLSILLAVRDIYFAGSALSLLMLCISMFIFCYFRRLHCDRIRIHKQLLLSLIFRAIILIILMQPGDDSGPAYMNEPLVCRGLVVLSQYFSMSNIFWMLVEGLFLYMRCVVAVFHYLSSLTVFYVIGWGTPAVFVIAWTVVMYMSDRTERCWMDYTRLSYAWIVSGPIVVVLVMNLYFLLHILVVLVTKMRADQQSTQFTEPWYDLSVGLRLTVPPPASAPKPFPRTAGELTRIRKALKAMFILLPLLGLTNLLFFVDPQDGGLGEDIYQIFNAVMQATQGMFVSTIYCFTNAEVQNVIRDKLGHRNHQPKFDVQGPTQRRSLLATATASTTVTQSHAETRL